MKIVDIEKEELKKSLAHATEKTSTKNPPVGYIPMELSAGGKFGVPKKFHIRNFQTGELLDLSIYTDERLPEKVISIINSMIFEDNIDIATWPDPVITELLVRLYVNFFTPIIPEVQLPWDESDIEYLKKNKREEEAESLKKGTWKPVTSLDLRKVKINSLDSSVKDYITISKTRPDGTKFTAKFVSYPRYGDTLVIKRIVDEKYSESDKQYEDIKAQMKLRRDMSRKGVKASDLPEYDELKYKEWQIYEANKSIFLARALNALYLVAINGVDISKESIVDKVEYTCHPEFDSALSKKLDNHYSSVKFGLDPDVEIMNPITKKSTSRRFSFRDVDIIQALREATSDEYDLVYDD